MAIRYGLVGVAWLGVLTMLSPSLAAGGPVQLQNGTATFSQGSLGGGPYSPSMAIDGLFDSMGWTIDYFPNNDPSQEFTQNETAVWESASDAGPSPFRLRW